jgi:hypothetical protein
MEIKQKCLIKNIMNKEYYTEDEIIKIGDHLKNLKGMILLDADDEFFILKDYDIKSEEIELFNWFKTNLHVQQFYIDTITITGDGDDYVHQDDDMCTLEGVTTLMEFHANYTALQTKLVKFTLKNGIQLNFGELTVYK